MAFEPAKSFIGIHGPYVAVRPLTASETVSGRYVDLLSPELQVVQDPEIPAGQPALLKDVGGVAAPGLMAASGRVEALLEGSTVTAFVVRAPEGPTGAARLAQGSRTFVSAKAWDLWGRPVPVSARQQSGSVLLRYENRADGVAVKAVWR